MRRININSLMNKYFKIFMCLLLIVTSSTNVSAVDEDFYSTNDILYYDSNACVPSGGGSTTPSVGGGNISGSVYVMGDSITNLTNLSGKLYQTAFKSSGANDVKVVASGAGNVTRGGVINDENGGQSGKIGDGPSGLEMIQRDAAFIKSASVIVIAEGTNGITDGDSRVEPQTEALKKAITAIKATGTSAKIYWVDAAVSNKANTAYTSVVSAANKAIYANSQSQGYSIISWAKVVDPSKNPSSDNMPFSDNENLLSDGIHPGTNGIKKLVDTVVSGVKSGGSSATSASASTCCSSSSISTTSASAAVASSENLETILRFLTGKGFSLAAAAGIAGNMQAESGLNPKIIQGGKNAGDDYAMVPGVGFGLIQWTAGSRQKAFQNFANTQNKKITDLSVQLDFAVKEMTEGYKEVTARLNTEKSDPVAAAIIVHGSTPNTRREGSNAHPKFLEVNPPKQGFEASGDTSSYVVNVRGGNATKFYNEWKGKIADGAGIQGADTTSSDGSTSAISSEGDCGNSSSDTMTVGSGEFKDSGEVAGYSTVLANAQKASARYGDRFVSKGWCLAITSDSWQGIRGGGYALARNVWQQNLKYLHKDKNPKKGAIMFSKSGSDAGHVFIYLENNKILNDGFITDADTVFGHGKGQWGNPYIGWMDPNDIGWKSQPISDQLLDAWPGRYGSHSGA